MSLLFEDLFKRLNADLKRQADIQMSKQSRASQFDVARQIRAGEERKNGFQNTMLAAAHCCGLLLGHCAARASIECLNWLVSLSRCLHCMRQHTPAAQTRSRLGLRARSAAATGTSSASAWTARASRRWGPGFFLYLLTSYRVCLLPPCLIITVVCLLSASGWLLKATLSCSLDLTAALARECQGQSTLIMTR